MSLQYGFYNSKDHDRRYDARDFSRLINCLIHDGIMANIGECFVVEANKTASGEASNQITIGSGLAWFNNTWSYNDVGYLMTLPLSDVVNKRIDAVVLEINESDNYRRNRFLIVKGTAATNPQKPDLINNDTIHQHALCYITRTANTETITQASIQNRVGTDETPFAIGVLKTISLDALLGQWEGELNDFIKRQELIFSQWSAAQMDEFERWMVEQKGNFDSWTSDRQDEFNQMLEAGTKDVEAWQESANETFINWLNQLQTDLSGDVAGNLQVQLNSEEIKRILVAGLVDGEKVISEDGRSIVTTAIDGRVLEKVFSDDFGELTTSLKSKDGGLIAKQVKTFDPNGLLINTVVTMP